MSVPPERMAPRTGAGMGGDPNKIMGMPKWVFFAVIALGLILAYYIYKRSTSNSNSLTSAAAGTTVDDGTTDTSGLTAADIGGTPQDNSFATQTDQTALEEQIQQLQTTLSQLQSTNGGNGASVGPNPPSTNPITNPPHTEPGGNPGPVTEGVGPNPPQFPPVRITTPITGSGGIGTPVMNPNEPRPVDIPVWTNAITGGSGPTYPNSGGIPLPPHLGGVIPTAPVKVAGGRLTQ